MNRYYTLEESEQFTFYRVPKTLIMSVRYKNVSAEAKLLYGLMLDRMGLSQKNGWADDNGRTYIYFTVEDACESLGCGKDKILRLFNELENADLIERRRQGQGKPAVVYMKKVISDGGKTEISNSEKPTSRDPKTGIQEVAESDTNDNKNIKTEFNEIYPSVPQLTEDEIREQIEYDIFVEREPARKAQLDEVVSLITDTLLSRAKTVRIGGADVDKYRVNERLRQLEFEHIEFVFDRMAETPTEIKNIRAYLLTAIYNAPVTMDSYYTALVNHDMFGR